MTHRILVADDSLTVQKVVSLTLASYDYKLIECKDESQLYEKLMGDSPSLLLLDLNLSESKTGYAIAKSIREKNPDLPIMLLLGTFDTVDEEAFNDAGLNDRIVKPFESNSFIQKIQSILESLTETPAINSEPSVFSGEKESDFLGSDLEDITPASEEVEDNGDDWVVDSPAPVDKSSDTWDSFTLDETKSVDNPLEASLEGWGMNVPGPISGQSADMEMGLPAVISDVASDKIVNEAYEELDIVHEQESKDPEALDLDYPDIGLNLDVSNDDLASAVKIEEEVDDFWAADDSQEDSTPVSLEDQLDDEEEEEQPYHAEPDESQSQELIQESISFEPLGDPRGNEPFELVPEKVEPVLTLEEPKIDKDELVAKLMREMKPMISELIEKHCKETIESVAWQIIPDLAENLIRSEIKEIKETL